MLKRSIHDFLFSGVIYLKIILYTDCMSIDIQVDEEFRYPTLLKKAFPEAEILTVDLDGMTTLESQENISRIMDENPDIVVYAFGVNNALPRGLTRKCRGVIIRWSYKVKLSKKLRLHFRTCFLNPLEYIMQIITKPKYYFTIQETISHIDKCMDAFKKRDIRTILINIAPVLNYRFIDANRHIAQYNNAVNEYCIKKEIPFVDAFGIFNEIGLENALSKDKFHYTAASHKSVAEELIRVINKIKD